MKSKNYNTLNPLPKGQFDFYRNDFNEQLHWGKTFMHLFGCIFSTYTVYHDFDVRNLVKGLKRVYKIPCQNVISKIEASNKDLFKANYNDSEVFLILRFGFVVVINEHGLYFMYHLQLPVRELCTLLKVVEKYKRQEKETIRKFFMVQYDGAFSLVDFKVNSCSLDIKTHYNNDFPDIDEIIRTSLNNNKNGLILLHGRYGTGKTSYLRYLANTINRKFIYFPLHMIESLSSPEFLPFISKHQGSVLILEDCESLLIKRENSLVNSSALANILNLSDGLLSDALKINVICTFNTGLKSIDSALMRKGRLIACYEFKELEIQKVMQLTKLLGHNVTTAKPAILSDIYNINAMDFNNVKQNCVGFRV